MSREDDQIMIGGREEEVQEVVNAATGERGGWYIKVTLEARAGIAQANRRPRGVIEWEVEQTYI